MPPTSLPTVPLARDDQGRAISLPADAAFWRVRRHTRGRPRNVAGIDREPLKLPLDFSEEDLHNMLGPGTYRLDLYDQAGEPLDLTVAATVGEPEGQPTSPPSESHEPLAGPLLPISGSDIRLVLEANVRATQLAFQHNERTLAASLKMAETLRDGVHVLAESQADWIKAMANARGFFRNAAPSIPTAAPQRPDRDEVEEDDDDDADDGRAHLYSLGAEVMKFVNRLVGTDASSSTKLLKPEAGFDWRALLDWRRAANDHEPAPPADTATPVATSPAELMRIYASLPADVRSKLDEVRGLLSSQEQVRLVSAFGGLSPDELNALMSELVAMPTDEIVTRIRKQLTTTGKE